MANEEMANEEMVEVYKTGKMVAKNEIIDMTTLNSVNENDTNPTLFNNMLKLMTNTYRVINNSIVPSIVKIWFNGILYDAIRVCDWLNMASVHQIRKYYLELYKFEEGTPEYNKCSKKVIKHIHTFMKIGDISVDKCGEIKELVKTEVRLSNENAKQLLDCANCLINLSAGKKRKPEKEMLTESVSKKRKSRKKCGQDVDNIV